MQEPRYLQLWKREHIWNAHKNIVIVNLDCFAEQGKKLTIVMQALYNNDKIPSFGNILEATWKYTMSWGKGHEGCD